ncbi:Ankyrin repeat-containing protein [Zostera marina]|uniref:Ankyrin repeat-containing protein n=1 Tax=Zostera marina TaxID=29655 RepID=A0A0K9Q3E8_ZOSMR|nr:Ankyrin repeat-containing protein [Zostera marina]
MACTPTDDGKENTTTKPPQTSSYSCSPIHMCVIRDDAIQLGRHLSRLPRLSPPSLIRTFSQARHQSEIAEQISAMLDRRDVPNGETPLHLAVRLNRPAITAQLLAAGADPSLQNSAGWNPFQESLLLHRSKSLSLQIFRNHRSSTIHKWRRRLPDVLAAVDRVRDFYVEINFKFESSVIPPFVLSRALPSDTYKIWKRGTKVRVDTSFAGYEGIKVIKSNRSFLFLDGNPKDDLQFGSVLEILHDDKLIRDCMDPETCDEDMEDIVGDKAAADVFRPGVDVTKAELVGRTNWRRKERVEMAGEWKARVYEIQNVFYTIKTRKRGVDSTAMSLVEPMEDLIIDEEEEGFLVAELPPRPSISKEPSRRSCVELSRPECRGKNSGGRVEKNNPEPAPARHSCYELSRPKDRSCDGSGIEWDLFAVEEEEAAGPESGEAVPPRRSHYEPRWRCEKSSSGGTESGEAVPPRRSHYEPRWRCEKSSSGGTEKEAEPQAKLRELEKVRNDVGSGYCKIGRDKEVKKSLSPTVWLTEDFPLKTEEVVPLLDVISNKVKPALRLQEMLTTKFPPGTFPVKIAIPVFSTVRIVISFTKFSELAPNGEQFFTPMSSPGEQLSGEEERKKSSSWLRWSGGHHSHSSSKHMTSSSHSKSVVSPSADPFAIPKDYTWKKSKNEKHQ